MNIVSLRKISLIFVLMLFSTVTTLGLVNYSPASVQGASINMAEVSARKEQAMIQGHADALARGKEYRKTHPIIDTGITPMPPDPQNKAKRIPGEEGWQLGFLYTDAFNIFELWVIGDKPNYQMRAWNTYDAYSGSLKDNPQQGFIGTLVWDSGPDQSFNGDWNTPQLWGSVKITNVTGDIISFSTVSGVTGTFNLTTHEWKTD